MQENPKFSCIYLILPNLTISVAFENLRSLAALAHIGKPFECILKDSLKVPEKAVTVAASLVGVMRPMKDGKRQEKREQSAAEASVLVARQVASCGTLSFYDVEGECLSTIRIGRMPESKKVTLKQSLAGFLNEALRQKPQLSLVKVADGAKRQLAYLAKELPQGHEIVDFYHAEEHLSHTTCL